MGKAVANHAEIRGSVTSMDVVKEPDREIFTSVPDVAVYRDVKSIYLFMACCRYDQVLSSCHCCRYDQVLTEQLSLLCRCDQMLSSCHCCVGMIRCWAAVISSTSSSDSHCSPRVCPVLWRSLQRGTVVTIAHWSVIVVLVVVVGSSSSSSSSLVFVVAFLLFILWTITRASINTIK